MLQLPPSQYPPFNVSAGSLNVQLNMEKANKTLQRIKRLQSSATKHKMKNTIPSPIASSSNATFKKASSAYKKHNFPNFN
jgi:hypothetical protein